jgi:hypothetical protein
MQPFSCLQGDAQMYSCCAIVLPLLLSASAVAVQAEPAPKANDVQLDWLVGAWCLQDTSAQTRETWLPKVGAAWFGLSHTQRDGQLRSFEYLRIAPQGSTLAYLAQPGGRPPTRFELTDHGQDWVRFENPQHDFPQRIEYRRTGDALVAEIAGPDQTGATKVIRFPYTACTDDVSSAPPNQ